MQHDFPGVRCSACSEIWDTEGTEPSCWQGECLTGFDRLRNEDHRILNLYGLLTVLADLGVSDRICREYQVKREDFEQLAEIAMEVRQLSKSAVSSPAVS